MKYGYMDMAGGSGKSAPLLSKDGLRNYIREFQVCWKILHKMIPHPKWECSKRDQKQLIKIQAFMASGTISGSFKKILYPRSWDLKKYAN